MISNKQMDIASFMQMEEKEGVCGNLQHIDQHVRHLLLYDMKCDCTVHGRRSCFRKHSSNSNPGPSSPARCFSPGLAPSSPGRAPSSPTIAATAG